MRRIDPVGLSDIAAMFVKADGVPPAYSTLKEYRKVGYLPPPAGFVNNTSRSGRVAVWDRNDIIDWAAARGWRLRTKETA